MLKDEKAALEILEQIQKLRDKAKELFRCRSASGKQWDEPVALLQTMLAELQPILQQFAAEEPALMAHLMCQNVSASLENIRRLKEQDSPRLPDKIQYELIPLIEELYVDLLFWGTCYPSREKMQDYYSGQMKELCPLPQEKGPYRYEVSVIVVAYNKLEYTKKCIQHIQQYFPADISHELILVNNGSIDGTKEYFESLNPTKQIDIAHNTKSFSVVGRVVEGKYILFISNDVLITPGTVSNLLYCIQSDPKIGCVVPTCPNVSCYQHIPAKYGNAQELIAFARQNNQPDPFRWEERPKVVTPILLTRSDAEYFYAFAGYRYPFFAQRFLAFSDDLLSMLVRRNGQKNILAKDSYVFHFGSITIQENVNQKLHAEGRQAFFNAFGIDPWGKGFCFEPALMEALPLNETGPVNVLGVNCGMGSNPLKIRDLLKEKARNLQVTVYNITHEQQFWPDLEQLADQAVFLTDWTQFAAAFSPVKFRYILVDRSMMEPESFKTMLSQLYERLEAGGTLAAVLPEGISPSHLSFASTATQAGAWTLWRR